MLLKKDSCCSSSRLMIILKLSFLAATRKSRFGRCEPRMEAWWRNIPCSAATNAFEAALKDSYSGLQVPLWGCLDHLTPNLRRSHQNTARIDRAVRKPLICG